MPVVIPDRHRSPRLAAALAGLLVAIPTLVAWSFFNKRVEVLAVELEGQCDDLIRRQYLTESASTPAAPAPRP